MEGQQAVRERTAAAGNRTQVGDGWYTAILHDSTAIEQLVASLEADDSLELRVRALDHAVVAVCWRPAQR
jgi:hypothetical protein